MTKRVATGQRPQNRARNVAGSTARAGGERPQDAPSDGAAATASSAAKGAAAIAVASSTPAEGAATTSAPAAPARRRSRWPAVLLPLLGAALLVNAALLYGTTRAPTYTSEALVAVLPDDPAVSVSSPLTSIWVQIANSDAVLDGVTRELDVERSDLDDALTVSESADAPLISIRTRTGDAQRSAEWANTAADQLLDQAADERVPGWSLEQVTEARPAQTSDPKATVPLVGGAAVLGALVGAAAAQLLAARARRRQRAQEL
ncbi:hypothetical protein [Blastococcus sp. TF02A-35]|uniref:hypothetical protein n=1 Tax=Blastococcus sp. TF02A-35 TaxID=2559612 RepID=UPI001073DCA0|nr:hypothetical protein [Blastococcus sp. TF02A_35]TFV53700.1 hypothetical protein E4P43_00120 [Blastococcus sp. TF02A_35]